MIQKSNGFFSGTATAGQLSYSISSAGSALRPAWWVVKGKVAWCSLNSEGVFGRFKHGKPIFTLPETNIAPENRPPQKETSIPTIHCQVRKC